MFALAFGLVEKARATLQVRAQRPCTCFFSLRISDFGSVGSRAWGAELGEPSSGALSLGRLPQNKNADTKPAFLSTVAGLGCPVGSATIRPRHRRRRRR